MTPDATGTLKPSRDEARAMMRALVNLNAQVLGITLGILISIGIFVATNVLILKGGEHVGAHLSLLGQFFYGYKVTFLGSIIGAVYGFVVGYVGGAIIAIIYNGVAYLRSR